MNLSVHSFKMGRIDVAVFSDDDTYYEILYEWCDCRCLSDQGRGEEVPFG
ncbi:MAG: hypothetical protein ACOXZ3_08065 [Synergistaceae bacterium]